MFDSYVHALDVLDVLDATDAAIRLPDATSRSAMREGRWLSQLMRSDTRLAARDIVPWGSIPKRTATRSTDDLDLYVRLDLKAPEWQNRGRRRAPEGLLDLLDRRLTHLLRVPIERERIVTRRQAHSVRVDMAGGVAFDVVPLAWCPRGSAALELPERDSGRWIRTAIDRQRRLFAEVARRHPGLRGGIRLLKTWRAATTGLMEERARWSSYALEVIAMYACRGGTSYRRPADVFIEVLRWLAADGLAEPVAIHRWRTPSTAPLSGPTVRDPAWLDNELMPKLKAVARRRIMDAAMSMLDVLRSGVTPRELESWLSSPRGRAVA